MRFEKFIEAMHKADADCLIIKNRYNIRYLTGFTGDAGVLYLDENGGTLVTDGRFIEQAQSQMQGFQVLEYNNKFYKTIASLCTRAQHIGIDGDRFTYDEYNELYKYLGKKKIISVDLNTLREIKERSELENLATAALIADRAFINFLPQIKAGRSEKHLAAILEYEMKLQGSEKTSFDTIVASGPRSSLPHAQPSERILQDGDFVTFDFGATYNGYHSDMTRTVVIGSATPWHKEIYKLVLEAQMLGVGAAKAGMSGQQLDAAVRKVIKDKGYGDYFIHGTGHGVGLEIHELPHINKLGTKALQKGMVFSIEPGIYIPSKGGVRIEDTVVLTEEGAKPLNGITKQLIEII